MTTLLYLMACLMSPAPLINLAESRVHGTGHKEPTGAAFERSSCFHEECLQVIGKLHMDTSRKGLSGAYHISWDNLILESPLVEHHLFNSNFSGAAFIPQIGVSAPPGMTGVSTAFGGREMVRVRPFSCGIMIMPPACTRVGYLCPCSSYRQDGHCIKVCMRCLIESYGCDAAPVEVDGRGRVDKRGAAVKKRSPAGL